MQLAGGLSRDLQPLRERLLDLCADVEAGLDFVDEDIQFIGHAEIDRHPAGRRRRIERPAAADGTARSLGLSAPRRAARATERWQEHAVERLVTPRRGDRFRHPRNDARLSRSDHHRGRSRLSADRFRRRGRIPDLRDRSGGTAPVPVTCTARPMRSSSVSMRRGRPKPWEWNALWKTSATDVIVLNKIDREPAEFLRALPAGVRIEDHDWVHPPSWADG